MMNIALVINTTDKYSFLWKKWYFFFKTNWEVECPVYWLNETKDIDFPFTQIKVNIPEKKLWTKKYRLSIEQIPEENLFVLLEDHFIVKRFTHEDFEGIYRMFKTLDADALRVKFATSKYATVHETPFKIKNPVDKLDDHSMYLVSHAPNLWKKSFLLECLKLDEDPWESEAKGTKRIKGKGYKIYSYIKPDWYVNVYRGNRYSIQGQKLIR